MSKKTTPHPKHVEKLTRSSMATVRANAARSTAGVLNRVKDCAEGKIEMTAIQLKASEIFLRKTLSDLPTEKIESSNEGLSGLSRSELTGMLSSITSSNPEIARMIGLPVTVDTKVTEVSSVIDKEQLNVINAKGEVIPYEDINDNEADYS